MTRCIITTIFASFVLMFSSLCIGKEVLVNAETCRTLTAYKPSQDVAYKAGVDVRGRSVKSADFDSASNSAPDLGLGQDISFPLILDIAKENSVANGANRSFQDHPGLEGKINLRQIVVKDGQITLDGKPIGAGNQEKLYRLCQQRKTRP